MRRALIVVDVQNDFCPGGSLPVEGGDAVASGIHEWLATGTERYELVVATMDWHPSVADAASFEHFSEHPDYAETWPPHCVAGSPGAELHPDLSLPDTTLVVRKGQTTAAYSGFEGFDELGRSLAEILQTADIDELDIVGLATDHCVRSTVLDAVAFGFGVRVLSPLTAGVAADTTKSALSEMEEAGVAIVH